MIRSLPLICCECQKQFTAEGELYYRDNFRTTKISETFFLCPSCIEEWKNKWKIKDAEFFEKDYSLYVDITLNDGSIFESLDCTPMDGIVVTSEEIPTEAQRTLFDIYQKWDNERKKNTLKDCMFTDEFMRTSFTCETYGGEKYENIAFRFNMQGKIETEKPIPDYIIEQIINAWKMYENQKMD